MAYACRHPFNMILFLLTSFWIEITIVYGLSSSGCGQELPSGQAIGEVSNVTITSGENPRSYLISIPLTYDQDIPTAVILSYHGGVRTSEDQLVLDGLTSPTFNNYAIVVYPQGIDVRVTNLNLSLCLNQVGELIKPGKGYMARRPGGRDGRRPIYDGCAQRNRKPILRRFKSYFSNRQIRWSRILQHPRMRPRAFPSNRGVRTGFGCVLYQHASVHARLCPDSLLRR